MSSTILRWCALSTILCGLFPIAALADGWTHRHALYDRNLGVAITPSPGWRINAPSRIDPHEIDFVIPARNGVDASDRLIIRPWGTTGDATDRRAASAGMSRLAAEFRMHVALQPVHYGGAPGFVTRSLPPTPLPAADIVLAYDGAIYLIIVPGTSLASDQRDALRSLRFIPRNGPFPSANQVSTRAPTCQGVPSALCPNGVLALVSRGRIRPDKHSYSRWFRAAPGWSLTYSVPCSGRNARLTVDVQNQHGQLVDRVLHRSGSAWRVQQVEDMGGIFRLDVWSECARWSVTAAGIAD